MGAGVDNRRDSLNDVVSTVGPVLKTFIEDAVRREVPNMKYVYHPELTFQAGIERFRANNQQNGTVGVEINNPLPLFIFRRSALRYPDDGSAPNSRSSTGIGKLIDTETGDAINYSFAHAEFDLDFLICSNSMVEMEKMEVSFLTEEGMTGTREIIVRMDDQIGDFKYFLTWSKLIEVEVQYEGVFYKAFASTVKIRGFFFQFNSTAKRIYDIKASIRHWYENIGASELLSQLN